MNIIIQTITIILVALYVYGFFKFYFEICDRLGWPNALEECWAAAMDLIREPLGALILGVTLRMEEGNELRSDT